MNVVSETYKVESYHESLRNRCTWKDRQAFLYSRFQTVVSALRLRPRNRSSALVSPFQAAVHRWKYNLRKGLLSRFHDES